MWSGQIWVPSSRPSPPQSSPFAAHRPLYPSSTREDDTDTRERARIETQNIYEIFTKYILYIFVKPMSRAYVCFRARCNCRLTRVLECLRARIFCIVEYDQAIVRGRRGHRGVAVRARRSGSSCTCARSCGHTRMLPSEIDLWIKLRPNL